MACYICVSAEAHCAKAPAALMATGAGQQAVKESRRRFLTTFQRAVALSVEIFNSCTSFPHRSRQDVDSGDRHPDTEPMAVLYLMTR